MGIDAVKPQFHTASFVRLLYGLKRDIHALTQEQRMVCPGDACVHPGQFRKMLGCFELTHAAPFHRGAAGIVDGVAGFMGEQGPGQSGEDGLVHLGAVQFF